MNIPQSGGTVSSTIELTDLIFSHSKWFFKKLLFHNMSLVQSSVYMLGRYYNSGPRQPRYFFGKTSPYHHWSKQNLGQFRKNWAFWLKEMLFSITDYLRIELGARHWKTNHLVNYLILLINNSNTNSDTSMSDSYELCNNLVSYYEIWKWWSLFYNKTH